MSSVVRICHYYCRLLVCYAVMMGRHVGLAVMDRSRLELAYRDANERIEILSDATYTAIVSMRLG